VIRLDDIILTYYYKRYGIPYSVNSLCT